MVDPWEVLIGNTEPQLIGLSAGVATDVPLSGQTKVTSDLGVSKV